ncbi:MAG: hypothetical protein JSR12_07710 [Bacteroidetes bacterium]|nr:hypothetical protein [Bacteroidota bacterium]
MKKLLLGSVVLAVFSMVIILFQLSCQKTASAQTTNGSGLTQLNKILFTKYISNGNNSVSTEEVWTSNYDGTNAVKVNIVLPSGIVFTDGMLPRLSPDGKKIFFNAGAVNSGGYNSNADIYSCNIDGSGVTKIIDKGGSNNNIILGGAY